MPLDSRIAAQRKRFSAGSGGTANPASRSVYSMALARALGVAARTGVFGCLADGPCTAPELAARLTLEPAAVPAMLDLFVAEGLLEFDEPNYELSADGRRWLDPNSSTSINSALSQALYYWESFGDIARILRGDDGAVTRPPVDDELGWLRRVRADYELARLISDEVAAAVGLPDSARSVLELGGGHAEYVAAMYRRNRRLRATVIGERGEVAIGHEIAWEADLEGVVTHQVGDLYTAELGGPHDAIVCHPSMIAASRSEASLRLDDMRAALRVGGVLVFFRPSELDDAPSTPAAIRLMQLVRAGGEAAPPLGQVRARLAGAGFANPRVYQLRGNPHLTLHIARTI